MPRSQENLKKVNNAWLSIHYFCVIQILLSSTSTIWPCGRWYSLLLNSCQITCFDIIQNQSNPFVYIKHTEILLFSTVAHNRDFVFPSVLIDHVYVQYNIGMPFSKGIFEDPCGAPCSLLDDNLPCMIYRRVFKWYIHPEVMTKFESAAQRSKYPAKLYWYHVFDVWILPHWADTNKFIQFRSIAIWDKNEVIKLTRSYNFTCYDDFVNWSWVVWQW